MHYRRYCHRMNDAAFPDMHDWTLLGVDFDWAKSEVTFRLRTSGKPRSLILSDTIEFRVPKHQPWGPSASVNRAELIPGMGDAVHAVRIEMQSGDVITAEAAAFKFE